MYTLSRYVFCIPNSVQKTVADKEIYHRMIVSGEKIGSRQHYGSVKVLILTGRMAINGITILTKTVLVLRAFPVRVHSKQWRPVDSRNGPEMRL